MDIKVSDIGCCTCCHLEERNGVDTGQVVTWDAAAQEWTHADATAATMLHVHFESRARDCDGPMDRSFIVRPNSYRPGILESPDDLWREMVKSETPTGNECGESWTKAWTTREGNEELVYHFEAWEPNDEGGGRNVCLNTCTDADCAYEKSSQRDYFAEAMGY